MATIPRSRKTDYGYFDWEYFYVREDECEDCPKAGKRFDSAHFHCRVCHHNVKVPRRDCFSFALKKHYINNPAKAPVRGKQTIAHDLHNPPRPVGTEFSSLTTSEKTLVLEGMAFIDYDNCLQFVL